MPLLFQRVPVPCPSGRKMSDSGQEHPFSAARRRTARPIIPDSFFVRRMPGGETILVVQNWSGKEVEVTVKLDTAEPDFPSYVVNDDPVDRSVKGKPSDEPLMARRATKTGPRIRSSSHSLACSGAP